MIQNSPTIEKILKEETQESVPCPICNADENIPENKKHNDLVVATHGYPNVKFQNVICKNCGLTRINPRMTKKGYDRFYKEAFFEYLDPYNRPAYVEEFENTPNEKYWTNSRAKIMPYIYGFLKREGGKVLDIGAGYGTILFHLKRDKKMDCLGIDPDPESVKIARDKFGIEVQDETVESYFKKTKNDNTKFDLIIMEQTFEHLLDPLWTLKEIKKRLAADGFVYIGVPNGHRFGAPFSLWFQLAHTYNYTPYALKRLAELAGLRVFDLRGPYLHPLEVLLCHADNAGANYPVEREAVLNIGKNYRDTLWEIRKKKYREGVRASLKNLITNIFGGVVKEKIRKFIDNIIGYKY